ncbi:putative fasciclin-like arabinogalactan protein 20 [Lycium ferocissimum]|uniref:putative fasciclin-like arabinogalactan protein 20 n=1 Tax=Lycium ferocissimum TaxID=112874 RepID=UPI0028152947|nr:putative fasciclin-like arabinogalactan protein 20 [Lycium ferocissimum]
MASFFFIIFFFTSLLTFSTSQTTTQPPPPPPQSLLNAVETLSNTGHISMSLTLSLITDTILSRTTTNSLTIFTPPDTSFSNFGQPSLSHILLHFTPISLSLSSLQSLPFSSKIPSLSPSNSLYITTLPSNTNQISINSVNIITPPIYDDGFVVIFAIDDFFKQNFTRPENPNLKPGHHSQCTTLDSFSRFYEVSLHLKSKGYLIMSSFLELQLIGFFSNRVGLKLTVFAPVDDAIIGFSGDFPEYQLIFLRHLVPCVLYWSDLIDMENGTNNEFKTYVNGFNLEIRKVNDVSFVNGVEISYPDLYYNDWLVVHGLQSMIPLPDEIDDEMDDDNNIDKPERTVDVSIAPDRSEF